MSKQQIEPTVYATREEIHSFLTAEKSPERIIKIECDYDSDKVHIIFKNEEGEKRHMAKPFYPFVWCTADCARRLYNGDRGKLKYQMNVMGITVRGLKTRHPNGDEPARMRNGYRILFIAASPMTYNNFMSFFEKGGVPIYPKEEDEKKERNYIAVSPTEQYMISTSTRLFKGYDDYDDLTRFSYDLETEGLEPEKHAISQIGMKTNKGFEKIITIEGTGDERKKNERKAINQFFKYISKIQPDVVSGYNIENFDFNFINKRLELSGVSMKEESAQYFPKGLYKKKKPKVLKLGGEMEYYFPTVMWGYNITDGLFAVRRAQAIDSNMKKADLKYITKYSKLNKSNRVYVPGKIINSTWEDLTETYALDDNNGKWFKIDNSDRYTINGKTVTDTKDGTEYELVTGRYIVQRYLLDDLYETDKVELQYNQANFLLCKMLPVSFDKMCTMGTAAIWKYIMLAWSFEHDLAIPELIDQQSFTGGLSRLLYVGFVSNIVKLDYNSLYPAIQLTFGIRSEIDITNVMLSMLEYILSQREHFKGLKGKYGKEADRLSEELQKIIDKLKEQQIKEYKDKIAEAKQKKTYNDKQQLPLKITGNGFFGSYGSGSVFPWSDIVCAEQTTCTGRQMLRLMISHFNGLGYKPIVGDSVTYDTPILIQRNDGYIDIVPICEIFDDDNSRKFENEQYRDFSNKDFKVLTRNGWCDVDYVYKHKTDKELRRIETKNGLVDCTIDHSLFDSEKNEIKSENIKRGDSIEIYRDELTNATYTDESLTIGKAWLYGFFMADGSSVYGERKQKYFSKRKKVYVYHKGKRANWKISNQSIDRLNKAKSIIEEEFNCKCSIKNHMRSSKVLNLVIENVEIAKFFSDNFYTSYRYKKVPFFILNASKEIKKSFIDGFCTGDGQGDTIDECTEFGQKSKVAMAGLYKVLNDLNINFRLHNRKDKDEFISFRFRNHHGSLLDEFYSKRKIDEVWINRTVKSKSEYVYDISCDGTFVDALGMIVCHNTDGFNFKKPDDECFRYTSEHPYIGLGKGRNVKEGKEYTGVDADVAEFEDTYMYEAYNGGVLKNGLGIDEYCDACIQFSRKNYADLMPDGSIKLVGNTIKSKKMPLYIENFLSKAIDLLLHDKGKEFIDLYYDYIEKIYNFKIPLKEIATVGKIKTSIQNYKDSCKKLTKGGTKKARQAWYELAIKHHLNVNMGDTIYYINTGTKKSSSDVQRITHYYAKIDGVKTDVSKKLESLFNKAKALTKKCVESNGNLDDLGVMNVYESVGARFDIVYTKKSVFGERYFNQKLKEEDEIVFNCVLLPNNIVEDEEEHYCSEDLEYNVEKYISMFNSRIHPLLVCFSRDIREYINEKGKIIDNITIKNPADRKVFTEEECKLVYGQPFEEGDQDTYEQLMTMEDKEIRFWTSNEKEPPYWRECGMDWEKVKSGYFKRMEELKGGILDAYNNAIGSLTREDVQDFISDNKMPQNLSKLVVLDKDKITFNSKKTGTMIGTIFDIIDKQFQDNDNDDE